MENIYHFSACNQLHAHQDIATVLCLMFNQV